MKVLRTIETFYPNVTGPANQAFEISSRLEKRGVLSPVLTTNFKTPGAKPHENIDGVCVKRFPVKLRFMQYTISPGLKRQLSREDCDIIHAHNYRGYHTQAAFKVARKKGIPFFLSTHGGLLGYEQYLKGMAKLPYLLFDLFTRKKAALHADAVIVNSKKEYSDALRYGVNKSKLHLIPVGVDIDEYTHNTKEHENITVLFVGRISRNRNVKPIITSAEILKKKHPEKKIKFIIVGGEEKSSSTSKQGYLDELKEFSQKLGVSEIVKFVGPKFGDELKKCYQNADIFVYTSLSENFGQTILEAGAAGLPIICTKVGIAPEIITNGKNGFLVDGKPEEIAACILELLDKDKRENFGKITRETVKKNFGWDEIIDRYVQIYKAAMIKKD